MVFLQPRVIEHHQIVDDRDELSLGLASLLTRPPRLLLPELVLDLIKYFLRFPVTDRIGIVGMTELRS